MCSKMPYFSPNIYTLLGSCWYPSITDQLGSTQTMFLLSAVAFLTVNNANGNLNGRENRGQFKTNTI